MSASSRRFSALYFHFQQPTDCRQAYLEDNFYSQDNFSFQFMLKLHPPKLQFNHALCQKKRGRYKNTKGSCQYKKAKKAEVFNQPRNIIGAASKISAGNTITSMISNKLEDVSKSNTKYSVEEFLKDSKQQTLFVLK